MPCGAGMTAADAMAERTRGHVMICGLPARKPADGLDDVLIREHAPI